ncbi:MAG: aminodeoxychorismate/anthranilate synthase component II [Tannerella sp.]|jgi:anthranilate synthase component 2|nr:aminodeoxychorismate/anthranilate synthase component II [Tannerella sp.]
MKCLLFDNYDSFTYNLYHMLQDFGVNTDVYRNDKILLNDVEVYDKILLSPGPGIPSEAGLLLPLIEMYAPTKSILGVCLGEQAIGEVFGAKLLNLKDVYHGVCSDIRVLAKDPLYDGLQPAFRAGRYHSWVVSKDDFPGCLEITAVDAEAGHIMGIRHRRYNVCGIQFHPESILTPQGKKIIENWLKN